MARGRPRKTLTQHALHGNPSNLTAAELARRGAQEGRRTSDQKVLMPRELTGRSREIWRAQRPLWRELRLLRRVYAPLLARLCQHEANAERFTAAANECATAYGHDVQGMDKATRLYQQARMETDTVRKLRESLGLTPCTRNRAAVEPPAPDTTDPAAEFLG